MLNAQHLKFGLIIALALGLSGCATDIMQGYIGRAPQEVMARYGPPYIIFDMPDGRRAYQWLQISHSTSTGSEESHTRWVDGSNGHRESVTTTQIIPSTTEVHKCFYTMYAHQTPAGGWVFDSFEKPEFGC
ncbi:hypothetical protein [Azospirillum sp. B4]|uniref:hypothetical protein n=1 Tax=Azospirillum sp. B4 TaxID=95605 RepID=UPI0011DCF06C|nr:hypothetical protein [Azospirillum sp. B4]